MKKALLIIFTFLFFTQFTNAQDEVDKAEANLIYSFTKFFDWPEAEKEGDFIIGIFGSKGLYKALEIETQDKKNITQNIVIKYFDDYDDITKCHVIFVNSFKSDYISDVYKKTSVHCLIISNSISAIEKGAAIQLFVQEEMLKYDFSQENALKHGLKFHSKISEMANKTFK